jgi:hypothetical protein
LRRVALLAFDFDIRIDSLGLAIYGHRFFYFDTAQHLTLRKQKERRTDNLVPDTSAVLVPHSTVHMCTTAIELKSILFDKRAHVEPSAFLWWYFYPTRLREEEGGVAMVWCAFSWVGRDIGCMRGREVEWLR